MLGFKGMTSLSNKDIAKRWRETVREDHDWIVVSGHARSGHQGGVVALSKRLGRRVYIKPKKPMVIRAAANEKLAADLGHDLGVNVPPAVLTTPPAERWDGQGLVVASLVMYGFQLHWGAAKHGVRNPATNTDESGESVRGAILSNTVWGEVLRKIAPVPASRAFVFDTWVGQADHNHPSNIAWGINPDNESDSALMFFDYEMAFGVGTWGPVQAAPFPAELMALLDRDEVERTVRAVEAFDEERLTMTVSRVPDSHLAPDEKADIIRQLLARRALVRGAVGV